MLPPLTETQVMMISLVMLVCGLGIGLILGGLWTEQRLRKRASTDGRNAHFPAGQPLPRDWRRDEDDSRGNVRISA